VGWAVQYTEQMSIASALQDFLVRSTLRKGVHFFNAIYYIQIYRGTLTAVLQGGALR
jgi:hypothetical protein